MPKIINIAGQKIKLGEEKTVLLNIARLPTRTSIDTPIIVSRGEKDGPVLLMLAGLHGDEINGVEILRQLLAKNYNRPEVGSVICVPVMNIYGFLNYSRDLPDGKDINRSFPGSPHGSLASLVAYHTMKDILPLIDYGIDFHTGGGQRANFPQVRCKMDDAVNQALAHAFNPPFIVNSNFRNKSLRQLAMRNNKRIIVYEGGESQRFDNDAISEGLAGARRIMKYLGLSKTAPDIRREPILIRKSAWVRAHTAGIFHSTVPLGAMVTKNQKLGFITDPYGDFEVRLKSPSDGYVIGLNNNPIINHGDALLHIGVL
ncbi:MAG: succinylglutamate desuccinylase/aspartoacylase family protein [Chitinophagales bacterium]|nr:succinylglutamate desuccinylase/aspartoacylase family protein [Chitinophagales bacterium]